MKNWLTFTEESPKIKVKDLISKYIIQEFGSFLKSFSKYDTRIRPQRTRLVKDTLTLLSDRELPGKPSYLVCSHGLSDHLRQTNGGKYKNSEWLYDLHWYTEGNEPYSPTSLPLVVECEWNPKKRGEKKKIPYSGIKYDFQKLLIANADLRLMIFLIK